MDSNSDSDSSVRSNGTAAFRSSSTIPASPNPNDPQYERGPLGERYIVVDHTANLIPGVKASEIWHHGRERRRTDNGSVDRYWRCGHCKGRKLFKVAEHVSGATSYAVRHLRNKHNIDVGADEAIPLQPPSLFNSVATTATAAVTSSVAQAVRSAARTAKSLISTLDMRKFRYLLIRWIVLMNICLIVVEHDSWRERMIHVHAGLASYLVKSGNTIKRWILKEFKRQKTVIKEELVNARSRIHISADLWTSPNSFTLDSIIVHYLDKSLKVQSILIGMRRVHGAHSGENIAEAMILVLQDFDIAPRLGYYIGDNHGANDTEICRRLRPDIKDPDSRRVRCLGHILNLAVEAFLFGTDSGGDESKRSKAHIEELRKLWRKKGLIGRLHNTVLHIRVSPERREEFLEVLKGLVDRDFEDEFTLCDAKTSPIYILH